MGCTGNDDCNSRQDNVILVEVDEATCGGDTVGSGIFECDSSGMYPYTGDNECLIGNGYSFYKTLYYSGATATVDSSGTDDNNN